MKTRVFTKPAICISIDSRGAAVVLGRAESVPNVHVLSENVQQKIINAIESRYPMIEAYVQHAINVPTVQMSNTARKLCGASDSDIESIVDDCIKGGENHAKNPTVLEIKAAREKSGLSQAASAALVYRTTRNWEQWEQGGENGRRMDQAIFELFLIKTGQIKI